MPDELTDASEMAEHTHKKKLPSRPSQQQQRRKRAMSACKINEITKSRILLRRRKREREGESEAEVDSEHIKFNTFIVWDAADNGISRYPRAAEINIELESELA